MRLMFLLSLFIYLKDTARCGEASSLYYVIDVVIFDKKAPADGYLHLSGPELRVFGQLEQIEFLSPADSRPAIIDP
jgi:hypothetical protein